VGVDCAGLIIGVGRELGVWPQSFDVNHYARLPSGGSLLALCREHLHEIELNAAQPGDVLAVHMGGDPCHLGFLGDYHGSEPGGCVSRQDHGVRLSLIHARQEQRGGRVCEHRLVRGHAMVPVAAFALPGVS
jgi:hypothetical protein